MSEDLNSWSDSGKVGAILGFGVFLITYLIVIVLIFIDISKNSANYDELIKDDLNQLSQLGLTSRMADLNEELKIRLSGVKQEDSKDDVLLMSASRLSADQYRQYM